MQQKPVEPILLVSRCAGQCFHMQPQACSNMQLWLGTLPCIFLWWPMAFQGEGHVLDVVNKFLSPTLSLTCPCMLLPLEEDKSK